MTSKKLKRQTFGLVIEYKTQDQLAQAIHALEEYFNPGLIRARAQQAFWEISAEESVRGLLVAYTNLGDWQSLRELQDFACGGPVSRMPVSAIHLLAGGTVYE